MEYSISSKNINVFPSVQRVDYESRQLTESRLTGLIRNMTPVGTYLDEDNVETPLRGFVITDKEHITSGEFEFNIGGYYFKISKIELIINQFASASSGTIWASINFVDGVIDSDKNDVYHGLTFCDSASEIENEKYALLILTQVDGEWVVPLESRLCSGIDIIDGGRVQ